VIKKFYRRKQEGFTLFELLVVISIIGLIVAVGMVSYSQAQKRGRDARRKEDLKAWQNALEQYYSANTAYPNIASCDPGSSFLPGGVPIDPKNVSPYLYIVNSCVADSYDISATLEIGGTFSIKNLQ